MTAQARWPAGLARPGTPSSLWLVLAMMLTASTLVAFKYLNQYEIVRTVWPIDPGFATIADGAAPMRAPGADDTGWQVEGDRAAVTVASGTLRLRNENPEAGVGIRQLWRLEPAGPRTFRLSADVASDGIRGSRKGFRVGEITLVADRDITRPSFLNMHRLAARNGTRPPARFVATFRFGHDAKVAELAIRLRHATGELRVSNLKLTALGERPIFRQVRLALGLCWAAMLTVGLFLFGRGIDHRGSALALGLAGLVGAALLLMPENLREETLAALAGRLPYQPVASDLLASTGHFLIFAATGLLVRLSRRGDAWSVQLALLVCLAGLSELLQYFAELRTPTLDDWVTNAVGAILGWALGMVWLWWRQDGQFATQRRSSTTVPPQPAKQRL